MKMKNHRGKPHQQIKRHGRKNLRSKTKSRRNDSSVKNNAKSKNIQAQNIQESWNTMKRAKLQKNKYRGWRRNPHKGIKIFLTKTYNKFSSISRKECLTKYKKQTLI